MTAPYFVDDQITLHAGDCLDVLKTMPDNSIDAIVTDPPYGLEFMGKEWDSPWKAAGDVVTDPADVGGFQDGNGGNPYSRSRIRYGREGSGFQQWCELWAAECLRVLKPGGHMLAFGGTRTWHRLACAVEDAGFEIRDSIAWLYGSGFPKSLDVSKAIDKAAGARGHDGHKFNAAGKSEGYASNGGSKFRSDHPDYVPPVAITEAAKQWQGWGTALKPAFEPIVVARKPIRGTVAANVLEHGTGALNIDGCRIGSPEDKRAAGTKTYQRYDPGSAGKEVQPAPHDGLGRWPANVVLDDDQAAELDQQSGISSSISRVGARTGKQSGTFGAFAGQAEVTMGHSDQGGASRFFPTFRYTAKAPGSERPTADGIGHPTVKPLELMRWLVRLVTPPSGIVLDPFAGSGTTGEAAIHEHKHAILIERDPEYVRLIVARLSKPMAIGFDYG